MCGALPAFFEAPTFGIVMASRVLVGIGFGLVTLRNACIRKMFAGDDKKAAAWLGITNALVTLTSSIMSPISGALADISLKYAYLLYFAAALPFLLNILFFK